MRAYMIQNKSGKYLAMLHDLRPIWGDFKEGVKLFSEKLARQMGRETGGEVLEFDVIGDVNGQNVELRFRS